MKYHGKSIITDANTFQQIHLYSREKIIMKGEKHWDEYNYFCENTMKFGGIQRKQIKPKEAPPEVT